MTPSKSVKANEEMIVSYSDMAVFAKQNYYKISSFTGNCDKLFKKQFIKTHLRCNMRNFENAMLKFVIILFSALFILLFPFTTAKGQQVHQDSLLLEERAYFYRKYKSVRDTMTINTWLNLKRVSDNLEQVVKRDQQVIDVMNARILSDSVIIANLTERAQLNEKQIAKDNTKNVWVKPGEKLMLYLKVAVSILFILSLTLLYFLKSRYNSLKKSRKKSEHFESLVQVKHQEIEVMDSELRRMKQRELDFRDELEKGMQLNQEKLLALQEKCNHLEDENQQLRNSREFVAENTPGELPDITVNSELPNHKEELKRMVKSLLDERNSLMNLAGKLRNQHEEEKRKNYVIINKISNLLQGLSEDKP